MGWALRYAWAPGDDEKRIEAANAALSDVVNFKESRAARVKRDAFRGIRLPKRPLESPILQPDILSGEWTLKPRDLSRRFGAGGDALAQDAPYLRAAGVWALLREGIQSRLDTAQIDVPRRCEKSDNASGRKPNTTTVLSFLEKPKAKRKGGNHTDAYTQTEG